MESHFFLLYSYSYYIPNYINITTKKIKDKTIINMKHHLLFLPALLLPAAGMAQTFSGGTGTAADPYLISSVEDLKELSSMVDTPGEGDTQQTYGKYFSLTQDITQPFKYMIGLEGFFKGDFNGNGHTINVDIDMQTDDYVGLFGTVKSGSVHDLAVKGSVKGRRYVGAIVANPTNEARLYNLVNYATVTSTYTSIAYVGGVIGGIISQSDGTLGGATVSRCANYGTVSCDGGAVGGVIGYSGQAVGNTISDIANYGYVENKGAQRVGGAVGNPMWNDKLHRIANFGTMSSDGISGCIGNSNPTDIGEIFYDRQYAHNTQDIPAQEKNTAEMTGSQMSGTLGEAWTYADGMLPRPAMGGQENSDLAVLYATPILLADGDNLQSVTKDFCVSTGNPAYGSVTWTAKNGLVEISADGTAAVKGNGLEVLTATLGSASRSITLNICNATGINDIRCDRQTDGSWYNIFGERVSAPSRGIYIHNGKKVIVK